MMSSLLYPLEEFSEHQPDLIEEVKDWQIVHGSLLKLVRTDEEHTVLSRPIGMAVYPSLFPKEQFQRAKTLQPLYNELYAKVAQDEEWLFQTLHPLMREGSLASILWNIHQTVKAEGYAQDLTLGIFRSDYMLHNTDGTSAPELKQVEFNGIACAGMAHAHLASRMHRHLCRTGNYPIKSTNNKSKPFHMSTLPEIDNVDNVAATLAWAHSFYGPPKEPQASTTAVLFVVQPDNVNICDERPLEYALWDRGVPAYRLEFGEQILEYTTLTPSRSLLYHPPNRSRGTPIEISIVYYRSGHEEAEYEEGSQGIECRLHLERSTAIKCPSILSHLSTFKIVQAALSDPSNLAHFLTTSSFTSLPEATNLLQQANMPLHILSSSPSSTSYPLATTPSLASTHILKPSLEGGGHNIHGARIPAFLSTLPERLWREYVLHERIRPPESNNVLIGPSGIWEGDTETELGVIGGCVWRAGKGGEVLGNEELGWTVKSKAVGVEEMSVVKGWGCFGSLCLV